MHRNDLDVRRAVCSLIYNSAMNSPTVSPALRMSLRRSPRPENIVLRDSQDDGRPCFDERDVAARLPIPGPPGTLECFDGFRSRAVAWELGHY